MYSLLNSARLYLWPLIGFSVIAVSAGTDVSPLSAFFFAVSLSLLASFGFLINDLYDRSVDSLNEAGRLENASRATLRLAALAASVCLLVAVVAAARAGSQSLVVSVFIAGGLSLYTYRVRRHAPWATFLAATLSLSPLLAPVVAFSIPLGRLHIAMLLGGWLGLIGREILLDVKDQLGDIQAGRMTLPGVLGRRRATKLGVILLLVCSAIVALGSFFASTWVVAPLGLLTSYSLFVAARPLLSPYESSTKHIIAMARWTKVAMVLLSLTLLLDKWPQ